MVYDFVSVGGGAAGFFSALQVAIHKPDFKIAIVEAQNQGLRKVKISGGGRCNVTHNCSNLRELTQNYPRGSKELLSVFSNFQPESMRLWLEQQGLKTKVEADGRVFPVTDSSQSIIDIFLRQARELRVETLYAHPVSRIFKKDDLFHLEIKNSKNPIRSNRVLLATGSQPSGYELARSLGHQIVETYPSLFSFNIKHPLLNDLAGTSFESISCELKVGKKRFWTEGPAVITHWGVSGPAILRLSAFAAKELHQLNYNTSIKVNWLGDFQQATCYERIEGCRQHHSSKLVSNYCPFQLTKRFWLRVLEVCGVKDGLRYSELPKKQQTKIVECLCSTELTTTGKTTNKEEFVTAGGVSRQEIDFRTMQSKIVAGLYFAGELIDIDAVTGGFNFQACWSEAVQLACALIES